MNEREAMASITVQPQLLLERILSIEIVRVTERAAVSAARLRGRGNEKAADQAAVDAMRRELNKLPIDGIVVIGEGELDEAPMLFIGETVGSKRGPKVDIAVDPLEGTTLCAKNMPGAIATVAMADGGTLLHAPDVYMERSEEHTSELQSQSNLVCRLLLAKKTSTATYSSTRTCSRAPPSAPGRRVRSPLSSRSPARPARRLRSRTTSGRPTPCP